MDINSLDRQSLGRLEAFKSLINYKPNNVKLLNMHKSNSKTRLILGGKRSGKTYWGAVETLWAGLGIHPYLPYPSPPLLLRICAVDFNSGMQIILPTLKKLLPPHALRKFWSDDRILELINGTTIDIKSYDQDIEKFEGVERHLVWFDEEPPRSVYESNYMRTISTNGKLIVTCTPIHGMSWMYDQLYDNPEAVPPYVENCHVSIYENPHLDPDAIENILHDPAMKASLDSVLHGQFISKTGLIYKDFSDRNLVDNVNVEDKMVVLGIDPHDRNPHGVVFCAVDRNNVWIVYDEIFQVATINELAGMIKTKLAGKKPAMIVIDTSAHAPQSITGRSIADELLIHGIKTFPAFKDWNAGIDKITTMISPAKGESPRLYVSRKCPQLIREFRHYVWDDWASKKDKYDPKEKALKKDDHLLDALRYAVMSQVVYRSADFKFRIQPPDDISPVTAYFLGGKRHG